MPSAASCGGHSVAMNESDSVWVKSEIVVSVELGGVGTVIFL
jgi:hypothetical protein